MGQVKTYLLLLIHCVFFKELLVHMFFGFDVKIRIQETKYEVETRLPLILFMVLEKLLCGVLLDTCATEAGLPGVGGYF